MEYIMYPERQGVITADSVQAGWPVSNLLNYSQRHVWKAADSVQTATLTVPIAANAQAIALYFTNADSASVSITQDAGGGSVWSGNWTISHKRYWQSFSRQTVNCTAEIELTTSESTLYAGIVRAGDLVQIQGPPPGMIESLIRNSIRKPLRAPGAFYGKKFPPSRTFRYQVMLEREEAFRDLMSMFEYYDPFPFAMLLFDGFSGADDIWTLFGGFDGEPSGAHGTPEYSGTQISLVEYL